MDRGIVLDDIVFDRPLLSVNIALDRLNLFDYATSDFFHGSETALRRTRFQRFSEPLEHPQVYVDPQEDHMKNAFFLAGCLLALGVSAPAFSQSVPERTGVNSTLGIAPKTEDFVKEVAISDMFEIESSKLAQQRGNAATKAFAGQMVTDHSKTTSELKSLVSVGKVKAELPPAMDDAHKSKLDKLNGLTGADFDKQYASDQQGAHKDAVNLFERYAKGGENADLKAWAGKTLPTLKHHKEMADKLK
jgi:putative membrane protein